MYSFIKYIWICWSLQRYMWTPHIPKSYFHHIPVENEYIRNVPIIFQLWNDQFGIHSVYYIEKSLMSDHYSFNCVPCRQISIYGFIQASFHGTILFLCTDDSEINKCIGKSILSLVSLVMLNCWTSKYMALGLVPGDGGFITGFSSRAHLTSSSAAGGQDDLCNMPCNNWVICHWRYHHWSLKELRRKEFRLCGAFWCVLLPEGISLLPSTHFSQHPLISCPSPPRTVV